MNKIIVAFALLVGLSGWAYAGGRQNQGWDVFVVTGNAITVPGSDNGTRSYLRKIVLSSATSLNGGDWMMVFGSTPNADKGSAEGGTLIPNSLFIATAAITPALIFSSGAPTNMNNSWTVGECDTCFVEIPANLGGIHIRKSIQATGPAGTAAIYWSK